jgi:hypothetical protein
MKSSTGARTIVYEGNLSGELKLHKTKGKPPPVKPSTFERTKPNKDKNIK